MTQSETLSNNLFTPHHYIVFFKVLNWVLFISFKIINYMVPLFVQYTLSPSRCTLNAPSWGFPRAFGYLLLP